MAVEAFKEWFLGRGDTERDGPGDKVSRYPLLDPKKVGYAVLLGSDQHPDNIYKPPGQEHEPPLGSVLQDLKMMEKSLKGCGFLVSNQSLVSEGVVKFDRTKYESVVGGINFLELEEYSCFLFYYTGHGCHEGILTADNELIRYSEIVKKFGEPLHNIHKPRVFIFDCCRKHRINVIFDMDDTRGLLEQEVSSDLLSDTIVCFSTLDFTPAWGTKGDKPTDTGSIFTKEFARALTRFCKCLPLTEIFIQACGRARGQMCTLLKRFHSQTNDKLVIRVLSQPVHYSYLNAMLLLTKNPHKFRATDFDPKEELKYWFENCLPVLESKGEDETHMEEDSVAVIHALDITNSDSFNQLCGLGEALEEAGFAVYLDVWRADELDNRSWLYWYTANIAQCNHVIVVCSPEMEAISHSKAGHLGVLGQVWSAICNKIGSEGGNKKFYPVLLRSSDSEHVPLVFGGTKYVLDSDTLEYSPESLTDFSKLVRHMKGVPVDRPQPGEVKTLGARQAAPAVLPADLASMYQTKKGYRPVQHVIPPQPRLPGYMNSQPLGHATPLSHPQYPPPAHCAQPTHHYPPLIVPQPVPVARPPHHSGPLPLPPSVLNRPPSDRAILWLSDNMTDWKFVGRYLEMAETDLTRIERENLSNLREQCYQMLHRWQQSTMVDKVTYAALVKALERAQCAPSLRGQFAKKIQEIEEEEQ